MANDALGRGRRVAEARRVALHVLRDVLGYTVPQAAPMIGMTPFAANNAAWRHARKHGLDPNYAPHAAAEAAECEAHTYSIATCYLEDNGFDVWGEWGNSCPERGVLIATIRSLS
jgi:hypothetical protein